MNAGDLMARLQSRWSAPEWLSFEELRSGPGWGRRSADFVAVAAWESGDQRMVAVEVKVDRGDWARELAAPAKSKAFREAAHWFWIAAPSGVVKEAELPHGWGLLEPRGDGLVAKRKAAINLKATGPTPELWVMMLRAMRDRVSAIESSRRSDLCEFVGRTIHVEDLERLAEKWHGRHCAGLLQEARLSAMASRRKEAVENFRWVEVERRWRKWIGETMGWRADVTPETAERVMDALSDAYRCLRPLAKALHAAASLGTEPV